MDVLKSLRAWQRIAEGHKNGLVEVDYVLLREAADEIERLQAIVDQPPLQ